MNRLLTALAQEAAYLQTWEGLFFLALSLAAGYVLSRLTDVLYPRTA